MTNKSGMENKLNEVYMCIQRAVEKNGIPPTVREIKESLGFSSTASAHYYIKKLKENGLIRSDHMKSRSIELTNDNAPKPKDFIRVPVVGDIAAGIPKYAVEEYEESYHIPKDLFGNRVSEDTFILRVQGSSMIDVGILNGDYILIRKQNYAKNGDIVAVLTNNDSATVKRFYQNGSKVTLHPENQAMQDMIFHAQDVIILGLVVGLIRTRI